MTNDDLSDDPPSDSQRHSGHQSAVAGSEQKESPVSGGFFSADSGDTVRGADDDDCPPSRIGDYEVLQTLGKGGMGVVYLARQSSVDRTVALKVIRPEQLAAMTEEQRQRALGRFRTEAQAAAQIDHENMVTLYEVGESDGQQFLSMRYVDGKSLAEILRFGPVDNTTAAKYACQVAAAVQEAHQRGILHRDLKPHNVLIDAKSSRALVTDFGLAKLAEHDGGLTRDGEVMGTPQYMSPEQARDSAGVTVRSDVYAIGATLYHMLTARPVFQAATVWETLQQVIDRQPVAPRQLNPAIDLDLETICMKCLEKEPERRYQSAGELTEELTRYLNHEPILARPVSTFGRIWRWSRRNRMIAASALAAVMCLVVALVSVSVSLIHTRAAFQRSEQSFQQALNAVNDFFTTVSEETLLDQPGLKPLRQDLMHQAQQYYQNFLAQREHDPTVEDLLGVTHYRVGLITEEIESPEAALEHFENAVELQRKLLDQHPNDLTAISDLANTLNKRGETLFRLDSITASLASIREARMLRQQLVRADPLQLEYRRLLANTHMNLGIVFKHQGNRTAAFAALDDAMSIRKELVAAFPDHPDVLRDVAKGHYAIGGIHVQAGHDDQAFEAFDQAIQAGKELIRLQSTHQDRYLLSGCYFSRAAIQPTQQALEDYSRALQEARPIALIHPNVDKYQEMVVNCGFEKAFCEKALGAIDDAIETLWLARQTAMMMARRADRYATEVAKILLEHARLTAEQQQNSDWWTIYHQSINDALSELPDSTVLQQLKSEMESRQTDSAYTPPQLRFPVAKPAESACLPAIPIWQEVRIAAETRLQAGFFDPSVALASVSRRSHR